MTDRKINKALSLFLSTAVIGASFLQAGCFSAFAATDIPDTANPTWTNNTYIYTNQSGTTVTLPNTSPTGHTTLTVDGGNVTIIGQNGFSYQYVTIVVKGGAKVTLQDLNIDNSAADSPADDDPAVDVQSADDGNTLSIAAGSCTLHGGGYEPGIRVEDSNQITIDKAVGVSEDSYAVLNVVSSPFGPAAIGGRSYYDPTHPKAGGNCGTVNIKGGTVTAKQDTREAGSHSGAGIGGSYGNADGGSGGTVNITGGIVNATGGLNGGAGIGGGGNVGGNSVDISITGGTVNAIGNHNSNASGPNTYKGGAGIGGGGGTNNQAGGAFGTITISGGANVTALADTDGAGIGTGIGSSDTNGKVMVSGESTNVSATGNGDGYDIGSDTHSTSGGSLTVGVANDVPAPLPTVLLQNNGTNCSTSNHLFNCTIQSTSTTLAGTYYAANYNLNGGTNSPQNLCTYIFGKGLVLNQPSKAGYSFNGWFTDSAFTSKVNSISTAQRGIVTLYAQWLSTDAALSGLTLSSGTLNESFAPNKVNYSANVAANVSSITVTPVANDSNASVKIISDGTEYRAGTGNIPLVAGDNVIHVTVTAQDGVTVKNYQITVTRPSAILGVTVTPVAAAVIQGAAQQFSATVSLSGNLSNAVNWTVTGNKSSGTTIDSTGKLTVAADESASRLLVEATSTADSSQHSTAIVSVVPATISSNAGVTFDLTGANLPAGVTSVSLGSIVQASGSSISSTVQGLIGQNQTLGNLKGLMIYDLKLLDQNGNPITNFTGKIKVKILIPAGMSDNLKVLWYNPVNGTVTDMNATQENGYLVFETTHFSYYAIAQLAAPAVQPYTAAPISSNKVTSSTTSKTSSTATSSSATANASTGDSSVPFLPLALLSAGSAAGLVVVKRRVTYRVKK